MSGVLRSLLAIAVAASAAACGGSGGAAAVANTPGTFAPIANLPAPATTSTTRAGSTTTATTATTVATTVAEPPRGRLVVNAVGDVNLDPGFVRTFPSQGYEIAWSGLRGIFLEDDLTILNLECSAGPGGTAWDKKWVFHCDPDAYPVARASGVDVANQANNHGADFGFPSMLEGSALLEAAGIAPVGAGADRGEAYTPALFEVDGWKVAVLGLSAVGPENGSWTAGEASPGVASATDLEAATDAIVAAGDVADLVFVTVHWGEELDTTPRAWVQRLGEAYIDAGADGVFGHHSHRLGPLTWYQGRPIAWSLGNFVWQAHPPESVETAIAQVVVEPDGRIAACLIPVRIESTGHPVVQGDYTGECAPAP
jgi:poly-gamma-glutamate synthesis protein (capsule biosynthesis protein)